MSYKGNPNLKPADSQISFTEEEVDEWMKCASDPGYFIENYIKIIDVDEGLVPFEPYEYQKNFVEVMHDNRFVIAKWPRQCGKSTVVVAYMLWIVLFKSEQKIAILANKGKLANELLYKIKLAYEFIPWWMQQGVVKWNEGSIELENRNKITASATSSSSIRGETYNLVFLDEFAHVGNKLATEFFDSVYPTISSGSTTKLFIVSTPKGLNHYYKIWENAVNEKNDYVPFEVHWTEVPGRDEEWKEQEIRNTSLQQFLQEQECEFVGSANTLIDPNKLRNLVYRDPLYEKNCLTVHEEPREGREYLIIADTAEGGGGDYSAFIVVDISDHPYRIVAKYRSKEISSLFYPNVIVSTAQKYNQAFVLIEINDVGWQVSNIVHQELEYENLIMSSFKGRKGQVLGAGFGKGTKPGVKTTKQLKRIGCSNLKDLIERDQLITNDYDIVEELSNFISNTKGTYEADDGMHDDLVMCMVIFSWAMKQEYLKEMTNTDFRKKMYDENAQAIEDDVLPFVVDDGHDQNPAEEVVEVVERPWGLDDDDFNTDLGLGRFEDHW